MYDVFGKLIAEYGGPTPVDTGTSYLTTDHLGSTRVVTNQSQAVVAYHDYLPFGEEISAQADLAATHRSTVAGYGSPDDTAQKFTGQQRDSESGLDYFFSRYFSATQGRFTGADLHGLSALSDPQGLNLYAYCRNNPLAFTDPTGNQSESDDSKRKETQMDLLFPSYKEYEEVLAGTLTYQQLGIAPLIEETINTVVPDIVPQSSVIPDLSFVAGDAISAFTTPPPPAEGADAEMNAAVEWYVETLVTTAFTGGLAAFAEAGDVAETVATAEKASSRILGQNMEEAGITRPADSAAHHIVAGSAKEAAPARAILQREGIGINQADNGVYLPKNSKVPSPAAAQVHSTLHTNVYYRAVNSELRAAAPGTAREVLRDIASRLSAGTFPH